MHGYVYWTELITADVKAARDFYGSVFNWSFSEIPTPDGHYWLAFDADDTPVCGFCQAGTAGRPAEAGDLWLSYIAVPDVDLCMAMARQSGGSIAIGPFDMPGVGCLAILKDAAGALLGVIAPSSGAST
ncbi:VOC family protein [Haematospirillum jordaniae]|uniref:VOC domain-containing protein n=1 Tax=Haematospirillum jordaniae TaxID=1549855 RepID=A0A143DCV4_9PROT|nr:VOC family protein [Haematospirillum jordaniae]AMW33948.1 hypothetical protein AY555_00775 [Haematospirillum jordaniae]NKD44406.1 VOC family protein [Haematospirillum jordaniae]NKD57426.1 VOC family protein [Haematospirillum jordaniae]NKD59876.1 VOC family protein [Haematospirillum jordaniae]NKD67743.1 VOC family protein [Haematospirillum jordaniae]